MGWGYAADPGSSYGAIAVTNKLAVAHGRGGIGAILLMMETLPAENQQAGFFVRQT